ncbi:transmembrane protein 214-B-like [Gigantopelta aegis]|uniref:transmembrane protein 214-B-like n=1 Tax=Gigantopelta aegis TaxID=1735272 RepID=UPI001B88CFEE|nr:transmembrane protein 214-B-like [Gigantopelta aegis]
MASTGQRWEVVGKPKKPLTKVLGQHAQKTQKKNFVNQMPKVDINPPAPESKTLYDAFLEKEAKPEKKMKEMTKINNDTGNKKPAPKKKVDQDKKQKTEKLEDVIAKIDKEDLQLIINQSHESFPDNPDVWLKDLASFLNLRLENVLENDEMFKSQSSQQAKDFPLCKFNKGCQGVIFSSLRKCSADTLEHLFYHCVQSMLVNQMKGLSTFGYRIFLQALAFHKPNIALAKIPQYLDLLKVHQNRPLRCLSILWAMGQCGVKDLKCGLTVWLGLMLPALGVRWVASFCVEYLENLFRWHKDHRSSAGAVTMREYFQVLDIVFTSTANIQGDLKKRLQAQYPKIKAIAYGENPTKTMRNFFPSYLSRLNQSCSKQLKQELFSCLINCLLTDKHTFATWCQMYTRHLAQSGMLLQHIIENWNKLGGKFDKKPLRETIRSFCVTNDEIFGVPGRATPEGFDQCSPACKELLQKMNRSPFPWFFFIFLGVTVLGSVIIYDMYTSKNVKASRTVMFLEKYGILAVLEQAWRKILTFISAVVAWLKFNVPVYYNTTCQTVGPYLTSARIWMVETYIYIMEVSKPHRTWIAVKTTQGIEWIYALSPDIWKMISLHLYNSWDFIKDYTHWVWKHIFHIVLLAYQWLLENVLVGQFSPANVQATILWTLTSLQNHVSTIVNWCSTFVATTSSK